MVKLPSLYVIGDSISLHYGPYLEEFVAGKFSYSRKAAELAPNASLTSLDYPDGLFSENAGDSSMVLAYLGTRPQAVATADVVLLNCGLHDLKVDKASGKQQVPVETYRQNLGGILELLAGTPAQLVWCTTTPVDDVTHARHGAELEFDRLNADVLHYNRVATSVMERAAVPLVDLYAHTLKLAGGDDLSDFYVDHVHFAPAVRAAQAAFIAAWLGDRFSATK